ncbi:hypothetical protein RRG08_023819 [Elysia crispata]|uniref:G-protein coupled receptors family 1 profile domain-containing protein n=1 Tax=Elysia crispata TaxID=231223 RepID=A0AAE0ZW59_9GAST|nr:hypothetical protein RRG08_023819 [Elysia crispata]
MFTINTSVPLSENLTASDDSGSIIEDTAGQTVQNTKRDLRSCASNGYYVSPLIDNMIFLFGVTLIAENLLMICVIYSNRVLHTNTNILVASLTFTDVMIGFQCFMMGLNAHVGLRSWLRHRPTQERIFHSLITGVNYGLILISRVHLAVLSVDRYFFVRWPFRYSLRVTKRRVVVTAIGIWTIGIIYMILSIVMYLDPQFHVNCIVVNAPFAYAGGPLMCVYFICLIIVIASTVGLSKLALDNGRKRGILKAQGAIQDIGKRKNKGKLDYNISLAVIPTGFIPSLTLQMITCINNKSGLRSSADKCQPGDSPDAVVNENGPLQYINCRINSCIIHHSQRSNTLQEDPIIFDENNAIGDAIKNNSTYAGRAQGFEFDIKEMAFTNFHGACSGRVHEIKCTPLRISNSLVQNTGVEGNKKLLMRTKLKILKFVLVILGCYLTCTFPFILRMIITDLAHIGQLSGTVEHVLSLMLTANSGMNFFIMAQLNKDFRKAIIKSFTCLKCFCRR